jgi:alanyl-tRNA synthetase
MQAKAFALLSEEGIAKGVRRIVAVTAADAAAAIAEGEALAQQVEAAAALPDAELEKVRLPCSIWSKKLI